MSGHFASMSGNLTTAWAGGTIFVGRVLPCKSAPNGESRRLLAQSERLRRRRRARAGKTRSPIRPVPPKARRRIRVFRQYFAGRVLLDVRTVQEHL
jgi:hypothetical protein